MTRSSLHTVHICVIYYIQHIHRWLTLGLEEGAADCSWKRNLFALLEMELFAVAKAAADCCWKRWQLTVVGRGSSCPLLEVAAADRCCKRWQLTVVGRGIIWLLLEEAAADSCRRGSNWLLS
jgi:hypothetical protein